VDHGLLSTKTAKIRRCFTIPVLSHLTLTNLLINTLFLRFKSTTVAIFSRTDR